jgi:anti-sigma factor RsiW
VSPDPVLPVECRRVDEDLAPFALGTLSGRERAQVLEHLRGCARCTAEVESLSLAGDALFALTPEAEPPVGFELRLVERFREEGRPAVLPRWRRPTILAAAAALVAVLGFGAGALVHAATTTPSPSATARPLSARLTADGKVLGQVFLTRGSPSWLSMTVDDGSKGGLVRCQVVLASGEVKTVGTYWLTTGYGAWTMRVDAPSEQVRSARLVDAHGAVVARATLRA